MIKYDLEQGVKQSNNKVQQDNDHAKETKFYLKKKTMAYRRFGQ